MKQFENLRETIKIQKTSRKNEICLCSINGLWFLNINFGKRKNITLSNEHYFPDTLISSMTEIKNNKICVMT